MPAQVIGRIICSVCGTDLIQVPLTGPVTRDNEYLDRSGRAWCPKAGKYRSRTAWLRYVQENHLLSGTIPHCPPYQAHSPLAFLEDES
jgi:hypothetical protein